MSLHWDGADWVDKWPVLHFLSQGLVSANLVTTNLRSLRPGSSPGPEESNNSWLVAVLELELQGMP